MKKSKIKTVIHFLPFIIFIITWCVVPKFFIEKAKRGFFEIQAPVWSINKKIQDFVDISHVHLQTKDQLIEVCQNLSRHNAFLEMQLNKENFTENKLNNLKQLLGIVDDEDFHTIIAKVVKRDLTTWFHSFLINKGRDVGIKEGMAVISSKGVVGRIKEANISTSIVELITSPTFRVAAKISGDWRPIIFRGNSSDAFSPPCGIAENIPLDFRKTMSSQLKLVSASFGGSFPENLLIGYINTVEVAEDGFFLRSNVFIDSDILDITEVAVLQPK